MSQDHERQTTDELCRLFSTTLHSLSADAAAVRQVSSLAKLSGVVVIGDEENNDNLPSSVKHQHNKDDDGALKGLRDLDLLVTGIEQKVVALREIVMEEKRALEMFETTLQEEADSQATILLQMLKAYEEVAEPQAPTTNSRVPLMTRRDSVDPRSNDDNDNDSRKSRNDPKTAVSFDRVTTEELKGFSRNTLGRVSRLDLNEALEEIEQLCQNKLAAVPTQNKSNNGLMTSNALQRRRDYLKQQRATVADLEVEAHAGHVWVSEQELRESCAFFRHGESTARATLSILCSLKRLKQIPGRNMKITYICLTDD
jgi:hypothetical protein